MAGSNYFRLPGEKPPEAGTPGADARHELAEARMRKGNPAMRAPELAKAPSSRSGAQLLDRRTQEDAATEMGEAGTQSNSPGLGPLRIFKGRKI